MLKKILMGATAALAFTTVSASAAVFTYDLTDNATAQFTSSGYSYGLRLDGNKGDGVDPQMIFSFDQGKAQLEYDDATGFAQITGTMVRSLAGGAFQDTWNVVYKMAGLTNFGAADSGMFTDTAGLGTGQITSSDGTVSYGLGAKADGGGTYFYLTDGAARRDGTADLTGRGWVNTPDTWMSTNDFLFNADLVDEDPNGNLTPVPLPATGLLLVAALGGLGAMRRRKTG